jgi:hypothetical protein
MTGKRFPDQNNKHAALPVAFDWQLVIKDLNLNAEGELFVDYLAAKIEKKMKARAAQRPTHKTPNLGEIGAREVAIALLACCWNGEIPDDFPLLVSLADVQKEEMTAEVWND